MFPSARAQSRCRSVACAAVLGALAFASCESVKPNGDTPSGRRDINAVLAEHDRRLMAIPGVAGVYVGILDDGSTPCLKVMLTRKDEALERSIPRTLDGYPVVTEVTGEIRPMSRP